MGNFVIDNKLESWRLTFAENNICFGMWPKHNS